MNNEELITVWAGGTPYRGWKKVDIDAAINEAARTFTLGTTEEEGEWAFPPGTAVRIFAGGDLVVAGYTNDYSANGDAAAHEITIKGRGKGQDFVDSAADHKTGYWEKKKPDEIAKDLDKFGVGIKARIPLEAVPYWQIAQGETAFENVERLLRQVGATMMGMPDGSIEITDASVAKRHAGALIEGANIKRWQVSLSDRDRHSKYTVKGQGRKGTGPAALRVKETADDTDVGRYRPKLLIHEGDTDPKRARKRAEHEKERAAGESIKGQVEVVGWRDDAGQLWTPNRLIYVESPRFMHLQQDMLIEKVSFEQADGQGSIAKLGLVDPRTYKGKQGRKGKKSDKAWKFGRRRR